MTSRSFRNSGVFLAKARSEKPSSSSSCSIGSTTTGRNEDVKKKQPSVQRRRAAWAPGFLTNSTTPSRVDWPRSLANTTARSICKENDKWVSINQFNRWYNLLIQKCSYLTVLVTSNYLTSNQLTSPKIEKAFSNNSLVTNGEMFLTRIAALWGAERTRRVRPLRTFPSNSRLAFSEFDL